MCKKSVANAQREVNYTSVLNKVLCQDCNTKLELKVTNEMAAAKNYKLADFKKVYSANLSKLCK
jgi:hypothetical protein